MRNKISKLFFLAVSMISGLIIGYQNVSAQTLTYENTDYYFERRDSEHHASDYLKEYKIDGKVAYCIEPRVHEGTDNYLQGNWSNINLPNEIKEKVLLIAYYGYTYPNHQTIKYRAATQGMLWETIMGEGSWVKFTSQLWGKGEELDISKERAEIERLVANHLIKPSFNGKSYNLHIGESVTIHDTNEILSEYIINANGATYSVNGNDLTLTATKTGEITLLMERKMVYDDNYKIFYGKNIQDILVAGNVDPIVASVKIKGNYEAVELYKKDKETGNPRGSATLEGAVYGVYKKDDSLVTTITTQKNGYGKSEEVLSIGEYYLKEITPPKGYLLDKNKYYFEITPTNPKPVIEVFDQIINLDFDITKVYASSNTGVMTPEVGIEFAVYDTDKKEVKKLTTDSQGNIKFNLPYGTYTLKQLTTLEGREKADDIILEVKESGPTVKKVIANAEIKSRLKILKIDKESQKVIIREGLKFKIKNILTGKYIKQTITYPTAQTIDTFEMDKNGVIITPYPLAIGRYALEEVENQEIEGYLWNSEPLIFEIKENSNFIDDEQFGLLLEIKFANEQVKGEIQVNKVGEKIVFDKEGFHYEEIKLDGVLYELYADGDIYSQDGTLVHKDKELVFSFYTKDGFYNLSNLYLGKYFLIERASVEGHVIDTSKHYFELKYKDQYTKNVTYSLKLKNYLKKSDVEFTKTDVAGNPLPNTTISIYTNNENEEHKLVFKGKTDKNGKIIIKGLFVSKFVLFETEAPEGFILNDEPMEFEIKENNEIIKLSMKNEKEVVEVPVTGLNDSKALNIIGLISIVIGISYIVYGKKKK